MELTRAAPLIQASDRRTIQVWWLAHREFLGRRPVLHSCTRTRSGQVLPALRAAIGAVLRPLLSFPLLLCRSSASPPHASQPRQRPSSPSRVWLEGESPSLSIKVLALFSAGFYPLTRRREATPFCVCHWSSPPLPLHPRARCLDHSFTSRITALATPPSLSPLTGPQFL